MLPQVEVGGVPVSGKRKVSEPSPYQEVIDRKERKRIIAMDEAFRKSMAAAIKRDKRKRTERTISRRVTRATMLTTDEQVQILTEVAQRIPVEKRGLLLERTAALMQFRSRTNRDFEDAVTVASVDLIPQSDGFVIPE